MLRAISHWFRRRTARAAPRSAHPAMTGPVWCIIPAAGAGKRAGGAVPKQYRPLLGKPMLVRTMERLAAHPRIAGLVVPLADNDTHWPGYVMCGGKPVRTCSGGKERADSVLNALRVLRGTVSDEAFVLVHDAARPCVPLADVERLLRLGLAHDVGALLAAPIRDTVKRANADAEVVETVPRDGLWRALTPQLFRLGELADALATALADASTAKYVTDEASALEFLGRRPLLVEGSEDNIKVTAAEDFARVEKIMLGQGERP
jgi:2-C-methyl-D-erythritol 4-phosphate cytidylyltransferase